MQSDNGRGCAMIANGIGNDYEWWFWFLAEINKIRTNLFQLTDEKTEPLDLPEAVGTIVTCTEKIYVPIKDYPEFNFVGRILGPRGMTAKQLEYETGCKIMVRGKGSMRDKKKVRYLVLSNGTPWFATVSKK